MLAAGVPLAWLALVAGYGRGPGALASTAGRWRWGWALRALPPVLAVAVLGALAMAAAEALAGRAPFGEGSAPAARQAVALLAVVVLTTPLQAAGEEFLFRGWLAQALGSWCARPLVGAVLAAVVSAALFSAAHGAQDPWLFADRFAFGLVASWLVHRTGGLEAAVVLHAVGNVVLMVPAVLTGALARSLEAGSAPPLLVVLDVAALLAVAVLVDRKARAGGTRAATVAR
ncbi:CPBP family intramembrane glutamic endopeptidase [Kineococcus sp. SYSU DK005]|uniref:CPBP family intramembrane glutamic endopeptidase n=1 Tax=Kineococcus sp. SYSU DK005 TaxID=3383126 RepID=UPI003D7EE04B